MEILELVGEQIDSPEEDTEREKKICEAVLPTVKQCKQNCEKLRALFEETFPGESASKAK